LGGREVGREEDLFLPLSLGLTPKRCRPYEFAPDSCEQSSKSVRILRTATRTSPSKSHVIIG
jgi:hypothetical protein